MNRNTIINYRFPVQLAIMVVIGILGVAANYYNQPAILVALLAFAIVLFINNVLRRRFMQSAVMLAVFILSILGSSLQLTATNYVLDTRVLLAGTIVDVYHGEDYTSMVLDDVSYVEVDEYDEVISQTKQLDGRAKMVTYVTDSQLSLSSKVSMYCMINGDATFKDSINVYNYKHNLTHELTESVIVDIDYVEPTEAVALRQYVLDTLKENMPENYGIAYALMLGDKTYIEAEDYDLFSVSGIAHMLAVSGLHISVLAGIVMWLLARVKVPYGLRALIVTAVLLLYGYLCGYPASILRAIIMFVITVICNRAGGAKDIINSMCLSAILILLIYPYYLFDFSFLLSYSAVFGIATVHRSIESFCVRKSVAKVTWRFLSVLSISLGATIGSSIMFLMMGKGVSLVSIITNAIVVPCLPLMFISNILGLVPNMSGFLLISNGLLNGIKAVSSQVVKLPFAEVLLPSSGVIVLLLFVVLFIAFGNVNIAKINRTILCSVLCVFVASCGVLSTLPIAVPDTVVIADSYSGYNIFIYEESSQDIHVISNVVDKYDVRTITDNVSQYNYNHVYLHSTNLSQMNYASMVELLGDVDIDTLYYYDCYGIDRFMPLLNTVDCSNVSFSDSDVVIKSVYDFVPIGISVTTNFCDIMVVTTDNANHMQYFSRCDNYDIVYTCQNARQLCGWYDGLVISALANGNTNNYGLNMQGNFTIVPHCDTITINRGMVRG